jgi:hypothetical protein
MIFTLNNISEPGCIYYCQPRRRHFLSPAAAPLFFAFAAFAAFAALPDFRLR